MSNQQGKKILVNRAGKTWLFIWGKKNPYLTLYTEFNIKFVKSSNIKIKFQNTQQKLLTSFRHWDKNNFLKTKKNLLQEKKLANLLNKKI